MPEQHRHLANKYEDIVNLQGSKAYCGGRPPTACYLCGGYNYDSNSIQRLFDSHSTAYIEGH